MWEQKEVDEVQAKRDKMLSESGAKFTNAYFIRAYDLQEGDLAVEPPAGTVPAADPAFAEGDDTFPDQDALDAALEHLAGDKLQVQAAALVRPVIQLINDSADYAEAMEKLATLYPKLDTKALEEALTRAMFVAELWGRANADA